MNMMKKTGGFTLVELIVVIAILAILAGVAVPAYSGYINKAKEAADLNVITAANTAADAATATGKAIVKSADYVDSKIVVEFDGEGKAQADADYAMYMENNNTPFGYYVDVEYVDGAIVGVDPS